MDAIKSNRDLYLAITELVASKRSVPRDLEHYLRALWGSVRQFRARPTLSANEFFGSLSDAFTLVAPPFDETWRAMNLDDGDNPLVACLAAKMGGDQQAYRADDFFGNGFEAWELFALRQIVDLREMAEKGMLANEFRYYGIDSPRGQRWYNFDPCTFLECGAAATSVAGRMATKRDGNTCLGRSL
jgi:hypothetical protein